MVSLHEEAFSATTPSPPFEMPTTQVPSQSAAPLLPLSVGFDKKRTYLRSSAILKHTLKPAEQVLSGIYFNAGTLCQVLAREAFFGKEVLKQCTPGGKYSVGLPRAELQSLKTTMFNLFQNTTHAQPNLKACIKLIESLQARKEP